MGYKINIYTGTQWKNLLSHDLLENLQGGNGVDEYYHLTADQASYIDQDVTIGSSPSFYNTNMSGDISVWTNDVGYLVDSDVEMEVHTQGSASTTWVVNHNYGSKYVITQAFNDADELIHPTLVELTDINNVTLTFDEAITGYVLYSTTPGTSSGTQPTTDHGSMTGLLSDDHTQYSLVDGTRAFTGAVGGITPTLAAHLTTKQYVDNMTWVADDIVDFDSSVSSNTQVSANTVHRTSDGSDHTYIDQDVTIGSAPQFSNANMYGGISVFTNDAGYISSESVTNLNAQSAEPSNVVSDDIWVEIT